MSVIFSLKPLLHLIPYVRLSQVLKVIVVFLDFAYLKFFYVLSLISIIHKLSLIITT